MTPLLSEDEAGGHLADRLAGGDAAHPISSEFVSFEFSVNSELLTRARAMMLYGSGCAVVWGKRPLIKPREFKPQDQAANARLDEKLSPRRSLVETVISPLKRKYGAAVSSRVWSERLCAAFF